MQTPNPFSRSTIITFVVMAAIIVIALLYIWTVYQQSEIEALESSQAGQAFTQSTDNYTDAAGNSIRLDDLVGEPFVVTSWASWCPHCFAELQVVDNVMADFPTIRTLGINRSESQAQVNRYLATQPTLSHTDLLVDKSDQFFATVQGYTMPETIVFDRAGEVVYHARGKVNAATLRETLTTAMEVNR